MRQPYASHPEQSRGRLVAEPESPTRTAYQRDRDRIIHSGAFRKLQYKTQVFIYHEGDYYRSRLTHSLEVAQVARSLCRVLGLDEDLAEAVALAHDLGHTPFGHAGEAALNAEMAPYGGFDHNDQTARILTRLEQRYARFDGLNLAWETLEGVVKHNGPVVDAPPSVAAIDRSWPLDLDGHSSAEAQVAALADDIAYTVHDIDDGLRAGLFEVEALRSLPLLDEILRTVSRMHPELERRRLIHETNRRLMTCMIEDVIAESRRRLAMLGPASAADIRKAGRPVIAFSDEMAAGEKVWRAFLMRFMYRHDDVMAEMDRAGRVVRELFAAFMARPSLLPDDWRVGAENAGEAARARLIADYIAGMTDRYAYQRHDALGLGKGAST